MPTQNVIFGFLAWGEEALIDEHDDIASLGNTIRSGGEANIEEGDQLQFLGLSNEIVGEPNVFVVLAETKETIALMQYLHGGLIH